MKTYLLFVAVWAVSVPMLQSTAAADERCNASRPNVLLIAIDDLNNWVGCLGGHPDARSPNIDRLATRGTLFTNAHCQAPICNPSRTSIMYGLRPSTSGVYMNSPKPWTVRHLSKYVTLPRWFAKHGYQTYTTGKIYHGSGLPEGDFDVVGPRPGQRQKIDERLVPATNDGAKGLWDFGAQSYEESLFQDYADASWGMDVIKEHDTSEQPFFLAVGFYRPHVPLYSPTRIFEQIPRNEIDLPVVKEDDRDDLPAIVDELTIAPAAPTQDWFVKSGRWKEAVQSYLACIRWTDEQVGRLLDALDASPHAKDTIVVLYSDHGFFLGEKQRWAKQSLWEQATHVPFIVVAPSLPPNQRCSRPAELLSIYPTLLELCGLPANREVEGRSVKQLLQDANTAWPFKALTTHGKDNHTVRSERYRYIRYHDGSEEFYDLKADPNEWNNLVATKTSKEHAAIIAELAKSFPNTNRDPAQAVNRKP